MSSTTKGTPVWTVARADVGSAEAETLLREYFADVSVRYYQLHFGRSSTQEEIEQGFAEMPNGHLAPPTGLFLIGYRSEQPAGCAALRIVDADTVELTRVFVRPAHRGTGGGARLLAEVEAAARGLGAGRVVLDTRLDLVEARALYTANGYAEIPAYSHGPYAEVWYGKQLLS